MAISLVAAGTPTEITAAGTLNLPLPAGVVSGDVLVALVDGVGTTAIAGNASFTTLNSSTLAPAAITQFRVAGASEPATYAWTISNASGGFGVIVAYRGVDNTTPVGTAHSLLETASSTVVTATGVTTSVNGCRLVWAGMVARSGKKTFTAPTGFANVSQIGVSTAIGVADATQTTAGATGNEVGSSSSPGVNNNGALIALAPAAGGSIDGNASGSIPTLTLSAATATATGNGGASGAISTLTLSAPAASASGAAAASGSIGTLTLSAATATATGVANTSGSIPTLTLTAVSGSASAGGNGDATGALSTLTLSAATATATGDGAAAGSIPTLTLSAPAASVTGTAQTSGSIPTLTLSSPTATASGGGVVQADHNVQQAPYASLWMNPF